MASAEKLVDTYVKIRDHLSKERKAFDEREKELKEKLGRIEAELLKMTKETGASSLKTDAGTATRMIKSRYWAPDWEEMKKFCVENDALDLLEKRVAQGNMKTFIEENPNLEPPVQEDRSYQIRVTRGKK